MSLAEGLIDQYLEAAICEAVAIPAPEWKRLTLNNRGHLSVGKNFKSIFPDGNAFKGFMDELKKEYPPALRHLKTGARGSNAFFALLPER